MNSLVLTENLQDVALQVSHPISPALYGVERYDKRTICAISASFLAIIRPENSSLVTKREHEPSS
jgi:hypothetical protein